MIKSIEGAINVEVAPAESNRTVEKSTGYLFLFISGNVTDPIAIVLALEEPLTPEKNIVEITETIPNPPRYWPTNTLKTFIILLAIPPLDIILPAKIKRGIHNIEKEFKPANIFCGNVINKSGESIKSPNPPAIAKVRAIGVEIKIKKSKTNTTVTPIITSLL